MTAIDPPEPGGIRHLLCQFEPAARDGLLALFCIEREIESSARPGLEHAVAHARLSWWEEECARLAAAAPRHPATRTLLASLQHLARPAPDLSGLVTLARWRLAQAAFETRGELERVTSGWARGVFAQVVRLTCGADGERDARLDPFGLRVGQALRELELLALARQHALQGLVYLPLDELASVGLTHESVQARPWPATLDALLRARLTWAAAELRAASTALPAADRREVRAALIWADQGARAARRAAAALPIEYAAGRFEPIAATWRAWRAARAALRDRLPAALR
jgi:phytoene synthase